MSAWWLMLFVAIAVALGGVLAALVSEDKGFIRPTKVTEANGTVYRPGFIGLILVGATAAALSWSLYGPLADATVIGGPEPAVGQVSADNDYGLTLSALGSAVLVGMGGSKWLSSEVDKALLKQTATTAAQQDGSPSMALEVATSSPAEALKAVTPDGEQVDDEGSGPPDREPSGE